MSAVTGNLAAAKPIAAAAEAIVGTGVDYVKAGFSRANAPSSASRRSRRSRPGRRLIAVLFADRGLDLALIQSLAAAGFKGVMLDTAARMARASSIMSTSPACANSSIGAHEANLIVGLAGSLEPPDIARLLPLGPDLLGFRGALHRQRSRDAHRCGAGPVDPRPHPARKPLDDSMGRTNSRSIGVLLSARGYAPGRDEKIETDRVFVHDLILSVSIGAYDFEREKTQRVRFNIDADVRRAAHHAEDMRDVFSYDVIVDAIRLVLSAAATSISSRPSPSESPTRCSRIRVSLRSKSVSKSSMSSRAASASKSAASGRARRAACTSFSPVYPTLPPNPAADRSPCRPTKRRAPLS